MEWYLALSLLFGVLLLVLMTAMPVAFGFMLINVVGLFIVFDGFRGLALIAPSAATSIATFSLTPLPMFILMGELLARSGIANEMLDAVDKWIGRVPGRLSVVTVTGGSLFGAMSGSSLASTALLGTTLGPEMERRGYKPEMSIAPVLGAAALDPLIPPSILAVLLAVQAEVSVGSLLLMGAAAGVVLAVIMNAYFVARAIAQPHLAPAYAVPTVPLRERIFALRHVVLVGALIFVVLGLIMTGTATPSESAALGAAASLGAVFLYRRFSWEFFWKVVRSTAMTSGMLLVIFVGSTAYSQLLAASGAGRGFVEWATTFPIDPQFTALAMVGVVFVLGFFIDAISIMLIAVPLFMPVVRTLGLDPPWFCLLVLICLEVGALTPPMGLQLFVLKGVRPNLDMGAIFRAAVPIVIIMWVGILIFFVFPDLSYVFVPPRPVP